MSGLRDFARIQACQRLDVILAAAGGKRYPLVVMARSNPVNIDADLDAGDRDAAAVPNRAADVIGMSGHLEQKQKR